MIYLDAFYWSALRLACMMWTSQTDCSVVVGVAVSGACRTSWMCGALMVSCRGTYVACGAMVVVEMEKREERNTALFSVFWLDVICRKSRVLGS